MTLIEQLPTRTYQVALNDVLRHPQVLGLLEQV